MKAQFVIIDIGENEMIDFAEALEDLVKFGKDNPTKVDEFFARLKEIREQMKQDFEAIREGKYKPRGEFK